MSLNNAIKKVFAQKQTKYYNKEKQQPRSVVTTNITPESLRNINNVKRKI